MESIDRKTERERLHSELDAFIDSQDSHLGSLAIRSLIEVPPEFGYKLVGQNEKLKRQLSEMRQFVKDTAHADEGAMRIIEALQEMVVARPEVPPARAKKLGKGVLRTAGILDIGDVHYGELVSPRSTGNIAQYSPEIARERFNYTIDEAIRIGKEHNIQSLWLILGGDMISGNIHDDLNRNNEMMTIAQTLEASEMIYGGIESLCQSYPEVNVLAVSGNHPRTEKIPFYNHKQTENLDYMLAKILEYKGINQPNLRFHTGESFWNIIDVEDRKFLIMHGDTIRQQNSMSLPWYGMWKEYMKWKNMQDITGPFHDMMIHHFHIPNRIGMGNDSLFVNGSLKGKDDYSLAGTRLPAPACQRFLIVGGGEVTADYMIKSEHIGKP